MTTESYVQISMKAEELISSLQTFGFEDGFLPCKLISSDGNYLYVEVASSAGDGALVEILIPHYSVVMVATGVKDKTLGFLRAAK